MFSARGKCGRGGTRIWEEKSPPLINFRVNRLIKARLGPHTEGAKLYQFLQLMYASIVSIIWALSIYLKGKVERGDEIMKRNPMKAKKEGTILKGPS